MLISIMAIVCSVGVTFLIPSADGLGIPTEVGSFLPGSNGSQSDTAADEAGSEDNWTPPPATKLSAYGEEPGFTPPFNFTGGGSLPSLTSQPLTTELFNAESVPNPVPRAALITISSPAEPEAQRLFEPATAAIGSLFGKPTYFLAGSGRDSTSGPTTMKIFYFTGSKWSELGLPPLLRNVEGRIQSSMRSAGETDFAGEIGSTIDPQGFGLNLFDGSAKENTRLQGVLLPSRPNADRHDGYPVKPRESVATANNGVKATFRPSFNPAKSVAGQSPALEWTTELALPQVGLDRRLINHFTAGNNEQGLVIGVWPTTTTIRSMDLRTGETKDLPVDGLPLARSEKSYTATSFARNSKAAVAVVKSYVRLTKAGRVQSSEFNRLVRVDLQGAPEIRTLPSSAGEVFSVDATADKFIVWTDLGAFITDDLIKWRNFEFDQETDTTYVGNESTVVVRLPKQSVSEIDSIEGTGPPKTEKPQEVVVSLPSGYSEKLPLPDRPAGIISFCSNSRFVFSLGASGAHRAEIGKVAALKNPQRWEQLQLPVEGIPRPKEVSWERCTANENSVFVFGSATDKTDGHDIMVVSKMDVTGQAFGRLQWNPCASPTADEVLMDATSDGVNSYFTIQRRSTGNPGDVSVVQLTGSKAFEITEIGAFSGSGVEVPMALEVHGTQIEVAGQAADSAVVWSADHQTDGLPCRDLL